MSICNFEGCGKVLSGSKYEYCRKHSHIKKIKNSGKFCKKCNAGIAPQNESGLCKQCNHKKYGQVYYRKDVSRFTPKSEAICFRCKKRYKARQDQHPKYSYCQKCHDFVYEISPGLRWFSRGNSV